MKKELVSILQNNNKSAAIEWILSHKVTTPLLRQMIVKEDNSMSDMIQDITKRVFLDGLTLKEFIEENQCVSQCIDSLRDIVDNVRKGKVTQRQKIKSVDLLYANVQEKIMDFESKIANFNNEMNGVIRQLQTFEQSIIEQFRGLIKRL